MGIFKTGKDYREGALRGFRQPGMAPKRMDRFLDQIEEEYKALQPKITEARRKVEAARNLGVSRDEIMRVMRLCVINDSEKNYGRIFKHRIETIWQDPDFDEAHTRNCDPVLDLIAPGQGPALADSLYFLLPDLILAGIEAKVNAIVPKTARGTLSEKRKAIAEAESVLADLERQSGDLVSQHRTILDDRTALPGSHRHGPSVPMMNDEGVT